MTSVVIGSSIDVVLCVMLVGTALGSVLAREHFKSIVLFISYGLIMAFVWARLNAPDVALAEAAIGAGLTGALFLSCSRFIGPESERVSRGIKYIVGGLVGLMTILICYSALHIFEAQKEMVHLSDTVLALLPLSGVEQPVTAVLLNFRSYDTFLELCVLFVALVGARAVKPESHPFSNADKIMETFTASLSPLAVLVVGFLLWGGSYGAGGAFQAGAVLGATGVLIYLGGMQKALPELSRMDSILFRTVAVAGIVVFLVAALSGFIASGNVLQYPAWYSSHWIVTIETLSVFSIGITLFALYASMSSARETGGEDG